MRKIVVLVSSLTAVLILAMLLAIFSFSNSVTAADIAVLDTSQVSQTNIQVNEVISDALSYIASHQQPDGGIGAFESGLGSNPSASARAVLALVAAGRPADSMIHSTTNANLVDYLAGEVVTFTHDITGSLFPERAGLMLAAASAANQDPTNFGGMDLISELEATHDPATGAYHTEASGGFTTGAANDLNQAWSILGLSSANQPIPISATNYLLDSQDPDGSWGFGDPDTTGMVVVALIASGNVAPTDEVIQNALGFYRDTQLSSGGWISPWDEDNGPPNVNTTAWVMQALATAGYTPVTASWANTYGTPRSAIISQQKGNGVIGGTYASTIEAVFGLTENPIFILGRSMRTQRALTWLSELQKDDGSWPDLFEPAGATADVVLAFMAAGYDPTTLKATGSISSAMDYLESQAADFSGKDPARAGKLALVAATAGNDPTNFGGVDLIDMLNSSYYQPGQGGFTNITGTYGITNTFFQAFPILGLSAAGETIPGNVKQTIIDLQQPDGGWKYDLAESAWNTTTPDNTGVALQALVAAGVPLNDSSIISATNYLRNQQDEFGGWGNANSTAYAIQGLLAIGEDLEKDWLRNGHSPYETLASFQKIDGPFVFEWDSPWLFPNDDFFATRQAPPALLSKYYPFTAPGLITFDPVQRGPDPDRLLAVPPDPQYGGSVDVLLPFGSDQDKDGSVTFDWRVAGSSNWTTVTEVSRGDGYFSTTLPISDTRSYEFRAHFSDPDGVQAGAQITDNVSLSSVLTPETMYLPLIHK
jgi:hypothetical protein